MANGNSSVVNVNDLVDYYSQSGSAAEAPTGMVYDAEVGDFVSPQKAAARDAIRAQRANLAMDRAVYGESPGYMSMTMRADKGPYAYMGDMSPYTRPPDTYGQPVTPQTLGDRLDTAARGAAEKAAYGTMGLLTGGLVGEGTARNIKEFVSTSPYLRHKDIMGEAYARLDGARRPGVEQYLSDSPAFVQELQDPYAQSRVVMHEKRYPVDLNPTKTARDYLAIERWKQSGLGPDELFLQNLGLPTQSADVLYDRELLDRHLTGGSFNIPKKLKDHVDRVQILIDTERQNPEILQSELDRITKNRKQVRAMRAEVDKIDLAIAEEVAKENAADLVYRSAPPGLMQDDAMADKIMAAGRIEALSKARAKAADAYNERAAFDNYSDDFYRNTIFEYEARKDRLNPELEQSKRALAQAIADDRMRYSAERLGPDYLEVPELERGYRVMPVNAPRSSFFVEPMSINTRTTDGDTIYTNFQYMNPAVTEEMLRLERMANEGGPVQRSQAEMLEAERRLNRLEDAAYKEKLYSRPKPGVDIDRSGMVRGAGAGMAAEGIYMGMQESTSVPAAYVKKEIEKLQGGNYIPDLSEVPEAEKPALYSEMVNMLNFGLPEGYFGSDRHKREEALSNRFGEPLTNEVKVARDMMKLTAKMQDQDIVKAGQPSLVDQFKDFGYTIVEAEAAAALAALL